MFDKSNKLFKILLIEDDGITNFITTKKLKNLGFDNVQSVENGLLALDFLKNETPDLILLDINMPIMDGFDFLYQKEKNNICPDVPIIMLSSSDRQKDQENAKQFNNVIDYLEKPLNYQKINEMLLKIFAVS